ncbi:hypothetical protein Tco_0317069 [Tanacetum coccineum]
MAAGGNIMRKNPQKAYDLIENMTLHHFQWDVKVYYDTTTGPGHPHTVYYSDSDESDEDEPSEVEKSKINPLIREQSGAFLMGDKEIKFNPLKDIDDPVPIPRNEESDESQTETIMEEVQIHSSQSTAQIPPPYEKYPVLLAGFPMIVKTTVLGFNPPTLCL